MKTIFAGLAVVVLCGCASMTPAQKRVAAVVGTAVVVGAVAVYGPSNSTQNPVYYAKPCPSGGAKSSVIYHC